MEEYSHSSATEKQQNYQHDKNYLLCSYSKRHYSRLKQLNIFYKLLPN